MQLPVFCFGCELHALLYFCPLIICLLKISLFCFDYSTWDVHSEQLRGYEWMYITTVAIIDLLL